MGKIVPYFVLGMAAMALSVAVAVFGFGVPFRGSVLALLAISAAFLAVHAGAGPADLDADEEPVRRQPGGADRGVPAGLRAVGLHLRDRQHARADPPADLRAAAALLRLQPADPVPGRGRAERAGAQRPGAPGDGGGVVRGTRAGHPGATGVSEPMWLRIRSLIIKELLAVWRDPKSRFIAPGAAGDPVLIFAFAATQEVKNVHMAVLNEDMGTTRATWWPASRARRTSAKCVHLDAEPDIARAIDSRSVLMVVHIRPDFSRSVRAAGSRPRCSSSSTAAAPTPRRSWPATPQADHRRLQRRAGPNPAGRSPPPASVVVARVWFNPNLDALWNTVPSLVAILVALVGLMVTALSVARERELGTFEQLLVSPLSPGRDRRRQDGCRPS